MFFTNPKKKHLKKRLRQTEEKIWELEYQQDRTEQVREDMRQQYDKLVERDTVNRNHLEAEEKKGKDADEKVMTHLKDLMARAEPDIKQMKEQLAAFDQKLNAHEGDSISVHMDGLHQAYDSLNWYIRNRI